MDSKYVPTYDDSGHVIRNLPSHELRARLSIIRSHREDGDLRAQMFAKAYQAALEERGQ